MLKDFDVIQIVII